VVGHLSKISISKSAATFTRYRRRRQLLSACGFAVFSVFYLSVAVYYDLFTLPSLQFIQYYALIQGGRGWIGPEPECLSFDNLI